MHVFLNFTQHKINNILRNLYLPPGTKSSVFPVTMVTRTCKMRFLTDTRADTIGTAKLCEFGFSNRTFAAIYLA